MTRLTFCVGHDDDDGDDDCCGKAGEPVTLMVVRIKERIQETRAKPEEEMGIQGKQTIDTELHFQIL